MYRTVAVIAIILGTLTVAFASSSFFHLRQVALSATPASLLDSPDFRVMTAGMSNDPGTKVIDAADFARELQTRIYTVFGVGLLLFLAGGLVLLLPRQTQHEQVDGHGEASNAVPMG